jgi:GTPase SAR1 family protein
MLVNNTKNVMFSKNYVENDFYSEFQIKTIDQTFTRLLNIIEMLSKTKSPSTITKKTFTITNLWIYIFKKGKIFFVFITPTTYLQSNKPLDLENEFINLITSTESMIDQCTNNQPHFDLHLNKFFENCVDTFVRRFNMAEIVKYESLKKEDSKILNSSIENKFNKSLTKKYLILGVGAVGKTSIISQFFDNWDLNELESIKPTIFKTINKFSDSYLSHNFTMVDLGGQEIYLQQHLLDENLFKNLNTVIFVLDLQNEKKNISTQKYFQDVLDILSLNKETPFISVFLHKYDPEIRKDVENNVQHWFTWLDNIFSEYSLPFSYYLTSIRDNSARESLARTLLLTIPNWFLALLIKKDLIFRSFNSLLPIISDVNFSSPDFNNEPIREELYNSSVIFGQSITKVILQNWIAHLMKDESYDVKIDDITSLKSDINIEFKEEAGLTELKFKCPLIEKQLDKKYITNKNVCSITHGLLTGLCQFTGLGQVTIVETQIRHNSEYCSFTIMI